MKSSDYVNLNFIVLLKKYFYYCSKIIYLLLGALFSSVIVVLLILIALFYFLDEVEIKDTEFHISDVINYYFENDVSFSSIKFSKSDKQFLQVVLKNFSSSDVNGQFAIDIKKIDMSFDLYSIYSAKPVLSKLDLDEPEIFYTLNNTNQNYLNDNVFTNYIMNTEILNIYNGNITVSNITKKFSYNFDKVNLITASRDNKRVILGKLVIKESIYSDQNSIFKFEIIDNEGVLFSKINFESFNPSSNFFNLLKLEEIDSVDASFSGKISFLIKDKKIKNIEFSLFSEQGLILLSKSPVDSKFINTYKKYSFSNLMSAGSYNFEEKSLIIDHLTFNLNNLNNLVFSGSLKRMNNDFVNIKVDFTNSKLTNLFKLHYQELYFLNEIPISGELNISLNALNKIIDFNLNFISHNNFVILPEEFIFDKDFTYIKDINVSVSSEKNSKDVSIETFGISLVNSKSETIDIVYKGKILDKENDFIFNGMINISNINLLPIISETQNYINKDTIVWLKNNIKGGKILNSDININISYNDLIKNKFIKDDFQLSMEVNNLEFILYDRADVIKFDNVSIKYKDSKISLFSSENDINGVQVEDINLNYFLDEENVDLSFVANGETKDIVELFYQNFRTYNFNNFLLENGTAEIKFFLKLPINKKLNIESIDKRITGSFSDFSVYNESFYSFIKTDKLENIFLNFEIEDNYMNINGTALAGNLPVNFEVFKNFNDFFSIELDFILNEQNRKDLQIDFINLKGNTKVSLAVEENESNWLITSNIDLYDNELLIPELNFIKNKKEICEVRLETVLDKTLNFNNLVFEFKNELLNFSGNTFFNLESNNFNIKIDHFNYGENDFQSEILIEPNNTFSVKIYGKKIFFPLFELNSEEKIMDLFLDIKIDEIIFEDKYSFYFPNIKYSRKSNGQLNIQLNAFYSDENSLSLNIFSEAAYPNQNIKEYTFSTDNAGAFLAKFGFENLIHGGKLSLEGYTGDIDENIDIMGTVSIDDFILKDAPIIAELLLAASFTGLFDLLTSDGIPFEQFDAQFNGKDNKYIIKKSRAYGFSLGFTSVGWIDRSNRTMDIGGSIIPAYTINSIFNDIPIIGEIFSGREDEGIFGVNYRSSGDWEDLDNKINPLSALTPGILRRIFDFIDRPDIQE